MDHEPRVGTSRTPTSSAAQSIMPCPQFQSKNSVNAVHRMKKPWRISTCRLGVFRASKHCSHRRSVNGLRVSSRDTKEFCFPIISDISVVSTSKNSGNWGWGVHPNIFLLFRGDPKSECRSCVASTIILHRRLIQNYFCDDALDREGIHTAVVVSVADSCIMHTAMSMLIKLTYS